MGQLNLATIRSYYQQAGDVYDDSKIEAIIELIAAAHNATDAGLDAGAIVTSQLADGAVTAAKIADGTITAAKFVSGVLTNETANGLEIVALKADTATLQKRVKNMISVLEFGAVADGDYATGTGTDNASAFQDAIDSLSTSGGGCLIVPPGIYKLSSQITVPSGVSISGFGKWTSILFCPSSFSDATGLIAINGSGGFPTILRGLGVLAQTGGSGGVGIYSSKNGVFVSDIWVNGFTAAGSAGIILTSTDNFLFDFVVEQCLFGITIQTSHINIENGTLYDCTIGLSVANNTTVEAGEVTVVNVRASACAQTGFGVSAGKNVTFSACSAVHEDSTKFSIAGFNIDSSSSVKLNGCSARIDNEDHTTGYGVRVVSSSDIVVNGGQIMNFYDGVNVSASSYVTINGIQTRSNARHGVIVAGGDSVLINAVVSQGNGGAGTSDSGIYLSNSAGFAIHSVTNCICTQNGGGPQEYGIYADLTDNGASSGVINIVGNTCLYNGTANISRNGKTLNITDTGNISP